MAAPQTKGFNDIVSGQAAAIQGSASGLVDFSVGSILRAIVEAMAQVVLWLQALILQLLATTRASTSVGADLDSWMADFGPVRLGAKYASGVETFSRITATQPGLVPVGTTLATLDGTQQYVVTTIGGGWLTMAAPLPLLSIIHEHMMRKGKGEATTV